MRPPQARSGASTLVLCSALIAMPSAINAQTTGQTLPSVSIEAPNQRQLAQPARKKPQRAASTARRSRPLATAAATNPPVPQGDGSVANASLGTPPIKQKYQLPQTSASITAQEIQQKINIVDTEDAVKYMPSLFVRKRNNGDTQPVLATRTSGLGASARSLVYADDILLTALIANNNTLGAPRWGLVAPEEIERVDFLYGPFSAAYPGNSAGGVLLITTKMPEKFEFTAKQTESFQTFDRYNTKETFRTDQTSLSVGDKKDKFSYFLSANYQNSYSQPLTWVTTGSNLPAGVTGAIPEQSRTGTRADVIGAGGLLHTEMANVKGKFAYDITPLVKATYTIGYWSNDANSDVQSYLKNASGATVFGGTTSSVSGFASSYYTLSEKHLANALSVKSDTRGTSDFDVAVSRYDYIESTQRNPFNVIPNSAAFTTYGSIARMDGTNWTNGDAKGIWRPNDAHEVSFGVHGDRYFLNSPTYKTATWNSGPDATDTLYSNSVGTTRTLGLWVQDAWRFAPMFKLTLGGRLEDWKAYDGYNLTTLKDSATGNIVAGASQSRLQPELDATRFSPKASLAFEPSREWLLTASVGQASRFPTVGELYQLATVGTTPVLPNPTLRPESVLSEEIAVERRFVDGKVRLSFFNENVHDALIAQLTDLNDGTGRTASYVTNVDRIRNTGVELAAQKDNVLIAGLETFGSITYVDSRILSDPTFVSTTGTTAVGKHVPNIPALRATTGVTYRPNTYWAFTAAMRYSSKQYSTLDNTDTVRNVYQAFDPFTVVDLRAQYRFSETAYANFGIDNVGDTKYTLFHPFPGRTYVADVRIKF